MTEMIRDKENNNNRWQPKDHNAKMPFEEQVEKSNKKNVILIVIYLTLLLGSLFTI